MSDPRAFVKFVLSYIKKHGDVFDHDQAGRMLSELEALDTKSPEVAVSAPQTTEPAGQEVAPPTVPLVKTALGIGEDNEEDEPTS